MKGIGKALARTPFAVTSKIGMSKKSSDPEFDDYNRHFSSLEQASDKLIKDTKAFSDAVQTLFMAGANYSQHLAVVFQPIQGEYDLIGKHPEAGQTIRNITKYESAMAEMRELITPELELISTRIYGPAKELQAVMKTIRKTMTKREHKLTDYDRHNNSLTKLRDKKEKSLSDEKNLFKLEQDFEVATNEYEYINTALKQDLPRFMMLSTQFIDPLFSSFFYMQLNIYYLILEKMQSFADESKYDITNVPGAQIAQDYEDKRTDAWSQIEELNIIKRIISVSKLVQASRQNSQATQGGVGRANSTATTSSSSGLRPQAPPSRSPSASSSFKKMPPPAPPSSSYQSSSAGPPPPYSASASVGRSTSAVSAAAAKRAPPPPPPLKPKPKLPAPRVQYVVALYDFVAQADGDLSFNAGDRIELVEKTESQEDWWTGRVNGQQGVFPGNYVQEA